MIILKKKLAVGTEPAVDSSTGCQAFSGRMAHQMDGWATKTRWLDVIYSLFGLEARYINTDTTFQGLRRHWIRSPNKYCQRVTAARVIGREGDNSGYLFSCCLRVTYLDDDRQASFASGSQTSASGPSPRLGQHHCIWTLQDAISERPRGSDVGRRTVQCLQGVVTSISSWRTYIFVLY